jgi:hypothetical protein
MGETDPRRQEGDRATLRRGFKGRILERYAAALAAALTAGSSRVTKTLGRSGSTAC